MAYYDPDKYKNGIFLFTLSTCIHCKRAKKLISDLGAEYDHVDVDRLPQNEMNEAVAEMSKFNPSETFPTILIGGKVIVGDREEDIRLALSKLSKK